MDKERTVSLVKDIARMKKIEEKVNAAKEQGLVFDSIEDIICRNHPIANFKISVIPGSRQFHSKRGLYTYECLGCYLGTEDKSKKTIAYDCPNCGIVLGDPRTEHYEHAREPVLLGHGEPITTKEGDKIYCKICNEELGR